MSTEEKLVWKKVDALWMDRFRIKNKKVVDFNQYKRPYNQGREY